MGKPCSIDLRERIYGYIAAGHSRRAAVRVLGFSASTAVRRAAEYRDRGAITPKPQGGAPGTPGSSNRTSCLWSRLSTPSRTSR